MSVIAWDGKTLAADKMATESCLKMTVTKIKKIKSGEILAMAGTFSSGLMLFDWYEKGAKVKDWPDCQDTEDWTFLIVVKDGKCFTYEDVPIAQPVEDEIMAWGSGRLVALGAMHCGADAAHACLIASKYVEGCGNGVDSIDIYQ